MLLDKYKFVNTNHYKKFGDPDKRISEYIKDTNASVEKIIKKIDTDNLEELNKHMIDLIQAVRECQMAQGWNVLPFEEDKFYPIEIDDTYINDFCQAVLDREKSGNPYIREDVARSLWSIFDADSFICINKVSFEKNSKYGETLQCTIYEEGKNNTYKILDTIHPEECGRNEWWK